jgi:hypothetical protein
MDQKVKEFADEALIRGLSLQTDAAHTQKLQDSLSRVTDWDYLLKIAQHHAVFPSLYRQLADACPEAVPPPVLGKWQRLYKINAQRNLRLFGELVRVLDLLQSHGIVAVPLKGVVLAHQAYGGMAWRQLYDLDLLVRRHDMPAVEQVLAAKGYSLLTPLTASQERLHLRWDYEVQFVNQKSPQFMEFDIHWRFPDFFSTGLKVETAFRQKILVTLEGRQVYSLSPADMLLFLCMHGCWHSWPKLSLVVDLARWLNSQGPWDWQSLLQYADRLGMQRRLLLGLSLATELLGVWEPDEIAARVRSDPVLLGLRESLKKKLLSHAIIDESFSERNLFQIKIRERFRDKLVFALAHAAVPHATDWSWAPLPESLSWLYPIIRPFRLVMHQVIQPLWSRLISLLATIIPRRPSSQ